MKTPDAIAITASTGIAACNIAGVTIHSFAGIGLGLESAEDLAVRVRKNKKASARWLRTKVLIIDEGESLVLGFRLQLKANDILPVSMVDGDLFDKLSQIGSILRKKPEPFGGIQVCVSCTSYTQSGSFTGFLRLSLLAISSNYHLLRRVGMSSLHSKPRFGTKQSRELSI